MLFKRIKDWVISITAFRTGDVIPVDGPDGTAKMSKDTLLELTAEYSGGVKASETAIRRIDGIAFYNDTKKCTNTDKKIDVDGSIIDASAVENYSCSDYVDMTFGVNDLVCASRHDEYAIAFYGPYKNFINGIAAKDLPDATTLIGGWYRASTLPSIPFGCKYIVITSNELLITGKISTDSPFVEKISAKGIKGIVDYITRYNAPNQDKGLNSSGEEVIEPNSYLSGYVDVSKGIKECLFANRNGVTIGLALYDKNKTFIVGYNAKTMGGTLITGSWYKSTTLPAIPENAVYARFAGNPALSATPYLEGINSCVRVGYIQKTFPTIDGISTDSYHFVHSATDKGINLKGEVVTVANSVCSDILPIGAGILSIAYGDRKQNNTFGIAFYDIDKNFISGSNAEYNSGIAVLGGWYKSTTLPAIPENAVYLRIAGNTAINITCSADITEYKVDPITGYADAPGIGEEFFTYNVDCTHDDYDDSLKSTSRQATQSLSLDNALIQFPTTYTASGKPTQLVLFNHGAGGVVTNSYAEWRGSSAANLLLKRGYAILYVNGVPNAMRNTKYLNGAQNGAACHMGCPIFLRSVKKAYDYVVRKYNLTRDVMVIGQSMGGLASLNIVMNGTIPAKCLAIDAPVVDLYRDGYFNGGWSGGTLGASTPGCVAWMYGWDGCDFDTDTYTLEGVTKSMSELKNNASDMVALWNLNKNRMSGFNAYLTRDCLNKNLDSLYVYDYTGENSQDYYGKVIGVPLKIWFGDEDATNQVTLARRLINKIRNAFGRALIRSLPTSQHGVWNATTTQGSNPGIDISTVVDGLTVGIAGNELADWLDENK